MAPIDETPTPMDNNKAKDIIRIWCAKQLEPMFFAMSAIRHTIGNLFAFLIFIALPSKWCRHAPSTGKKNAIPACRAYGTKG